MWLAFTAITLGILVFPNEQPRIQHQVTIGCRNEQAYGTPCRKPDGSWEVVSGSGY